MATIDDTELSQLRESASRATAAEAELSTAREELAKAKQAGIRSAAEAIVAEAFGDLDAKVSRRSLVSEALAAEAFDPEALKAHALEAVAEIRALRGEGNVHGAGVTGAPGAAREAVTVSDKDIINALHGGN